MKMMATTKEYVSFETLFHAYEPLHSGLHYWITLITLAFLSCSLGNSLYCLFFTYMPPKMLMQETWARKAMDSQKLLRFAFHPD